MDWVVRVWEDGCRKVVRRNCVLLGVAREVVRGSALRSRLRRGRMRMRWRRGSGNGRRFRRLRHLRSGRPLSGFREAQWPTIDKSR